MASLSENFEMVQCPYDPAHQMLRKKLQSHIIKCRTYYPAIKLVKCPFNASHMISEVEMAQHVKICPDKNILANYKHNLLPFKQEEDEEVRAIQQPVETEENWDNDEVTDYNPKKKAQNSNVLLKTDDYLPKQRKEFRKAERKRLGDYSDDDDEVKVETKFNPTKPSQKKVKPDFTVNSNSARYENPRQTQSNRAPNRREQLETNHTTVTASSSDNFARNNLQHTNRYYGTSTYVETHNPHYRQMVRNPFANQHRRRQTSQSTSSGNSDFDVLLNEYQSLNKERYGEHPAYDRP